MTVQITDGERTRCINSSILSDWEAKGWRATNKVKDPQKIVKVEKVNKVKEKEE
jgi:hypothetical protein